MANTSMILKVSGVLLIMGAFALIAIDLSGMGTQGV
jgi:hypothetical protein